MLEAVEFRMEMELNGYVRGRDRYEVEGPGLRVDDSRGRERCTLHLK
jgi:hypothetical protein